MLAKWPLSMSERNLYPMPPAREGEIMHDRRKEGCQRLAIWSPRSDKVISQGSSPIGAAAGQVALVVGAGERGEGDQGEARQRQRAQPRQLLMRQQRLQAIHCHQPLICTVHCKMLQPLQLCLFPPRPRLSVTTRTTTEKEESAQEI